MNAEQTKQVHDTLRAGAIQQQLDDEHAEQMLLHIRPLPYERTIAAVRRYLAEPNQPDRHGNVRPKFVSSVDELLTACDVTAAARHLVADAVQRGGEVWPDLRQICGWSWVAEDAPPPLGVLEWKAISGVGMPAADWRALEEKRPDVFPALPAPAAVPMASRIGELRLSRSGSVATLQRPKVEPIREIPDALQDAIDRLEKSRRAVEFERAGLAELRRESLEALEAGDVPAGEVKAAAERLLRRLADDPDEGRIACVEALSAACWPGLELREMKQLPDEDEPTTVRVVLKRRAECRE